MPMSDPIRIHIEIGGNAQEALERLAEGIKGRDLVEALGLEVVKLSRDRITSRKNTAPDGTKWAPLSPSTLKRKKAKGFGHQGTLMQQGTLWRTIHADNATDDSVDVGSMSVYAMIHQKGGKAGRGRKATIPARPYLGISRDDEGKLQRWLEDWVRALVEEE